MEHPTIHPAYLLRSLAEFSAVLLLMCKVTCWPLMPWWMLWAPLWAPLALIAFLGFLAVVAPRGGPAEPDDDEEPHDPNDDKPRLTSS